jgi:DNA-binding response OmpR family regulator
MKGRLMEPTRSILLCEEDAATRSFLAENLVADGYEVLLADTKATALAELETPPAQPGHLRRAVARR